MSTFTADVMQFLLPGGRQRPMTVPLPESVYEAYEEMVSSGCRFEAEILGNGIVSVTISNDEADLDLQLSGNGPGDVTPATNLENMLKTGEWKTVLEWMRKEVGP